MGIFNRINFTGWFNWFNFNKQENHVHVEEKPLIVKLEYFIGHYPAEVDFMACDKLLAGIQMLQDRSDDVQIVAMGGMGKSRLIYEAFKDVRHENAFFCYHSQGDSFVAELEKFFQDPQHGDGLLVLDNCNNDMITYARSTRNNHGSKIRMVFAHHDYFEQKDFPLTVKVDFNSKDMRDAVDEYIQKEVYRSDQDRFITDRIKELADGYPQMAIILVTAYKRNGRIGVRDVESLLEPMLGQSNDERRKVMECLSLFRPLGYRPPVEKQYEAVLASSILTGLYCSMEERRDIFDRTISHFRGEIVEVSSSWLNVRPLPLAIWLMGKWLESHSEDRLKQLITDFDQLPYPLPVQLGGQMYRRLRNMEGNAKACDMIGALLQKYENDPFGAEEVVCSELGSQLFLGFAHVNPLATARCIHSVIAGKSIDDLKNLKGGVRRNIVWALEKLCYPADCFEMAATDLLLLSQAENENFGNNATGQLTQLFHLLLPGTETPLEMRSDFLKSVIKGGAENIPLAVKCLDQALQSGDFVRMGGADEFSSTKRVDYMPKSEAEVTTYWSSMATLLTQVLNDYPEQLPEIKRIVENRSYGLMHKGRVGVVNQLTEAVYAHLNDEWMEMYQHYRDAKKYFYAAYPPESQHIIDQWIERLSPRTFANSMKEVRMKVFDSDKRSFEDERRYAEELFKPLVADFIGKGAFDDKREVRSLLLDKEYFDFGFSQMLIQSIDDEQLAAMLHHYMTFVQDMGDDVHSPFFYQSCGAMKGREPYARFLNTLHEQGYDRLYVKLLANTEDESLSALHRIEREVKEQGLGAESIRVYLQQVGWMTPQMMLQVLNDDVVKRLTTNAQLIAFIERFQFGGKIFDSAELLAEVKKLMLAYEYNVEMPSRNRDYAHFLIRLLEKNHDPEFAKVICRHVIEIINNNYTHGNFEGVFIVLLKHYVDDVWEDFAERLVDEDYSMFFYQVKDEVGSGTDFGRGEMYQHGDERIRQLCVAHPERAPYCIGLTCPVFSYRKNDEGQMMQEDHFSNILMWLLENYGHQDNTLDGAGANIGSFSWTGSPIGLFRSQIACFKELLTNPKMHSKVKKWAEAHIGHLEEEIKREQGRLDFERMHYQ